MVPSKDHLPSMVNKTPIRILRVIARLNIGGPAIQAITLTEAFSGGAFQSLLVCGTVGAQEGDMSYLAHSRKVVPHILPHLGREISPFYDLASLGGLRRVIRKFRPHIIHTHTAKAGTLGRIAGLSLNAARRKGRRIKMVHTFHGHVFHSYFSPLKTLLFIEIERLLARFTDRIIVISPLQQQDICRRFRIAGPEGVRVIPLGFDFSAFAELSERGGDRLRRCLVPDNKETMLVGIVGRLTHVKNHRMLLEAVKILKDLKKEHGFTFVVVGDGELKKDLLKYAGELGVADSVRFTGWVKDMAPLYKAMDLVTLTSLNEGTPVTLIEAMAAGKPVIATAVGGVPDLLGCLDSEKVEGYKLCGRGILVPAQRADLLAEALLFSLEHRELVLPMAEQGRDHVRKYYSEERLIQDLSSLYSELAMTGGDDMKMCR